MRLRGHARASGLQSLLALLLCEQLLIPTSAWGLAADGSTLAGDRGVQPDTGALAAALPADLFSGAATHRIPIELPPGTGGMTPELTLAYSSAGPLDSWVGSRWSLALPSISRSLKRGVPSYDDSLDVFTFDGQELVPENANPELPRRYHTRRESFLRITHEANGSWSVERKDGERLRFGLTANAVVGRQTAAHRWLLSEREDTHGNVMVAVYDRSDAGNAYPLEVRYGLRRVGSSIQSLNGDSSRDRVVSFLLETRSDAPESYAEGFERRLNKRLDRIDVRVGGQLIRRYDLSYVESAESFRSLLAQVAILGSDGDSSTPTPSLVTAFAYHSNIAAGTTGWESVPWPWPSGLSIVQGNQRDNGVRLGDVDGDGLLDLIKAYATTDLSAQTATFTNDSGVYLNTGSGFATSKSMQWVLPTYANNLENLAFAPYFATTLDGDDWGTGRMPIDLTGDGRVDLVGGLLILNPVHGDFYDSSGENPARLFAWPWFQSSPGGWLESPIEYGPGDPFISLLDGAFATAYMGLRSDANKYMTVGGNTRFADLTGDGLPEMIVRGTASSYLAAGGGFACNLAGAVSYVIYNEGNLVFRHAPLAQTTSYFSPPPTGGGEPGCAGQIFASPNDFAVCASVNADGCDAVTFFSRAYGLRSDPPSRFWWDSQFERNNTAIDINADGLADAVSSSYPGTGINNGNRGFTPSLYWTLNLAAIPFTIEVGARFSTDLGVRFADVNGDGRVDMVKAKDGETFVTWLNDGDVSPVGESFPWRASTVWISPTAIVNSAGKDRGVRLVDVDGDGMVDVVRGEGSSRSVRLNRGKTPDLLTRVTSPLGAQTTFGYAPSTQFDHTGGDGVPDLPQILPLVTSISINDANGTTQTTTLDYEGGVFDGSDRELRGFRRVTATRAADGRTITTLHHQDVARAGLVESVEIRNGEGILFARSENTYVPDADGIAPYTPLLASTLRLEYDGLEAPRRSLTTLEYDGGGPLVVGNVTAVTEYGEVSADDSDIEPLDTRTTELDYALPSNPGQAVPYIVDRVSVRRVRAGAAPGSGEVLRESRLYYDGDVAGGVPPIRGDLTHRVDVLDEPNLLDPTTRFDYDAYGNLTRITSPRATAGEFSAFASIEYDALYHTFPVAMVNELGHRAELSYATPAGCSIAHAPAAGLVHEVRDPNALAAGKSTLRCYDAFGRLVRERAPDGLAESNFAYVDTPGAARITRSDIATAASGVRTSTVYLDGLGRAVKTSSQGPQALLVEATARFDAAGRLASETAPRFTTSLDPPQTSQYAYDVLDRRIQTTLPGVNRIHRLAYDRGLITATDANSNVTRTALDAFGRVTAVEETGLPGSPVTYYEYDALGQLERVIDSGQNETVVEYDKLGRKTSLLDPDTGESLYGHDGNGNLTFESNALGAVAWFYDALDRPSERRPSSGQRAAWSYDRATNGIGRLAEESRSPIKYLPLAYDLLGRPTRERFVSTLDGPSHEIQTSYDPLDQVTSRAYPSGITALWQRDTRGFLTGIATGTGETYADQIEWSPLGQLAKWRTGALATTTRRFEPATGRLGEIEVKPASGASYEYLRYGYDFGDRITSVTDLVNPARDRSFGFDVRNRLTSATGPYGTNAASQALHYQYDLLGNLLCRDGFSPTSCLGGAAFFYPTPGPGVVRPHAPTIASLGTLGYDDAGNLTALGSRGYEYDVFGQLVRVRDGGALQSELFYDATGRLARVIDSVTGQTRYRLAPDFEWNPPRQYP